MTIEAAGAEIAKAIAPVIAENQRALLHELKAIGTKPTGMDRVITQKEFQLILREGYSAVNLYL
jgi:hypothetical protein